MFELIVLMLMISADLIKLLKQHPEYIELNEKRKNLEKEATAHKADQKKLEQLKREVYALNEYLEELVKQKTLINHHNRLR